MEEGKTFKPHKHIWKNRTRDVIAQESWVVIQGKVRCTFFDIDDTIIDEPILGVGLQTGDLWSLGEDGREIVTPEDRGSVGGVNVLNINVGNITKEADYLKLKPLVQRWMLEAASRRGNV